MIRNSEQTRIHILEQSSNLFNTKGYKTTSISDITKATNFTKGAIYRHYESKEDLEVQAFKFMAAKIQHTYVQAIKSQTTVDAKLFAIIDVYKLHITTGFFKGGCPLLNAAIESDHNHATLKIHVQETMQLIVQSIERIFFNGIKHGQLYDSIDPKAMAHLFVSSLEGAVMMSHLYNSSYTFEQVTDYLKTLIKRILIPNEK